MAWSLATCALQDEQLLQALSSEAIRKICHYSPQHLSTTAWAYAKLLIWNPTLFNSIASESIAKIYECDPQAHANLAWAFATLARVPEHLLQAISAAALTRIDHYEPQELSNISWSFARLKVKDRPLMTAIAAAARNKLSEFSSLNISNTVWALAVLSERSSLNSCLPLAIERFVDLADFSMGTEWVDLVSTIFLVGQHVPVALMSRLVERFEENLFTPAVNHLRAILDPMKNCPSSLIELKEFLDAHQLPHLGQEYSKCALNALGWLTPGDEDAPWVSTARFGAWAAQGVSIGNLVRTERIVAWVAASLCFRDIVIEIPGRFVHQGIPNDIDEEVQAMLLPTFRNIARDDHAERAALLHVLASVLKACNVGVDALLQLAGWVRLYASHYPCMSCVAVCGQLSRIAPGPLLEIAFDDAWQDD
mmetsp:Transcript_42960/g.67966  ORF Transcript_42960/g.67966 Transcript_42960/m.67966 type:complete len:422 (+) Transcript_42960:247-1512(+)